MTASQSYMGYYRWPTVNKDTLVFVCDDDLWRVPLTGGDAIRLSTGLGNVSLPHISPDGKYIAFKGEESGTEDVYIIPVAGGQIKRLTYFGMAAPITWTSTSRCIIASSHQFPLGDSTFLYEHALDTEETRKLDFGVASDLCVGKSGFTVLARNMHDTARWKRYRGGNVGTLWVQEGKGLGFKRILAHLNTNLCDPIVVRGRIYFLADHEGIANIYSCSFLGLDIRRHTHHTEYYARNLASDGIHIVYHAGAEIFCYDIATNETKRLAIHTRSSFVQALPRFVENYPNLHGYAFSEDGEKAALIIRGKLKYMPSWGGGSYNIEEESGYRFRMPHWFPDGKSLATICSRKDGQEEIVKFSIDKPKPAKKIFSKNLGKVWCYEISGNGRFIGITNNRNELWLLSLDKGSYKYKLIERNDFGQMGGLAWSPDSRYLAYDSPIDRRRRGIKLLDVKSKQSQLLVDPVLEDWNPIFDSSGHYLFFLGIRDFCPTSDLTHFNLSFPFAVRPYAIVLRKDVPSPFCDEGRRLLDFAIKKGGDKEKSGKIDPVIIDRLNIEHRIVSSPIALGVYDQLKMVGNRLFFLSYPVQEEDPDREEDQICGSLRFWDFEEGGLEDYLDDVLSYRVMLGKGMLAIRLPTDIRICKAEITPDESDEKRYDRKNGWVDIDRLKVRVDPKLEWEQMFKEAWMLQLEHFWTKDMSAVDWNKVFARYFPLLARVHTRSEFSDLVWEMQGELGTSHCYEFGGDYFRKPPYYPLGSIGALVKKHTSQEGVVIKEILSGDSWGDNSDSPLNAPGVSLKKGDRILAVDGVKIHAGKTIGRLLENKAGVPVTLTVSRQGKPTKANVVITPIWQEKTILYRQWVERNRKYVHEKSQGKIGYVHVPDMMATGYSEFCRSFLPESMREGLIIDVRYNCGGYVSQLILRFLMQRVIGYDVTRWAQPEPYPMYATPGPMVAMINELTGSDGDIFSHAFKSLNLGPLVGKRSWGGVVGIETRYSLNDGSITTQPEYSLCFFDTGFTIENYGVDPDIDVDISPDDWAKERDPQLECAVDEAWRRLVLNPPPKPKFDIRPVLSLPTLGKVKKGL